MTLQDQLLQYLVSGLTTGAIYALIALGLVAIYNVTGAINFAQGESAMLGALILVSLRSSLRLPLALAFVLSVVLVALVGLALHRLAIRPARNASPVTVIIITIGASIALRGLALVIWGTDSYSLAAFSRGQPIQLGSAMLRIQSLWVVGVMLASVAALYVFFQRTLLGKALRACAVNRMAARLMGINQDWMASLSFALGGALGAMAGAVIAPITYATYDMGAMLGLKGFVAAIIGGLTSMPGAVAGGLLLGVLETAGAGLISSGAKDAIAFGVLLLVLLIRPRGLFATREGASNGL